MLMFRPWLWLVALALALMPAARGEEIAMGGGSVVDLHVSGAKPPPDPALLKRWIENAGRAIVVYYGKYPVSRVALRVRAVSGHEVSNGMTYGYDGNVITIDVGRSASEADLKRDWVLTHEMLHVGFPSLADRHHWLEEGLAVYVESIARARAGFLTPAEVWKEMMENLPQGLPEKGDRGLDGTHTWGRTYYGGAIFALRADVEIRRRTNNRRGLEHVLRALVAAGGTIEHEWKMDRVIAAGDAATGVPVLRELYDEMKDRPVTPDLPALWKELGIVRRGATVTFDDTAPLAAVRKAITAP